MPSFNDLNLDNWKVSEIWTDSLWIIPERDKTGKHSGFYHGNFVPQIPHQLILRYTKKDEIVFDPFLGSGTTAYEAESLNRNFIGIDIQKKLVELVEKNIEPKNNFSNLIAGDSAKTETFFQPLSKAANDIKRQICKKCKETSKRWSAKNIKGNPYDFYIGDENYSEELGCRGCYQYDPVEYRKVVVKKIGELSAKEAIDSVFKKLYPDE